MDRETECSVSPGGYVGATTSDGFSVTTIGVTVVGVVTVVTVGGSVVGCVVGISEITTEGVSEVVSVVTSECVVTGGGVVGVSVVMDVGGGEVVDSRDSVKLSGAISELLLLGCSSFAKLSLLFPPPSLPPLMRPLLAPLTVVSCSVSTAPLSPSFICIFSSLPLPLTP
jgi:hypothetical protein